VGWPQILSGGLLTAILLILSVFYSRQQIENLRLLKSKTLLEPEDLKYHRYQLVLRLSSALLLLFLALMLGFALVFLENRAQDLANLHDDGFMIPEDQKPFTEFYRWFWILFLLLLLMLVVVAGVDLLTVRRWGLQKQRKLLADRREMLEQQLQQIRRDKEVYNPNDDINPWDLK